MLVTATSNTPGDGGSAGRSGGRDCDETECDQAAMRSLPARSAPSGAPPGGRQINSKDTQTSGSVVRKSEAADRKPGVAKPGASVTEPMEPAMPASSRASVNAEAGACSCSEGIQAPGIYR